MYVACRTCHWQQDDFWDEQYNPTADHGPIGRILIDALSKPPAERHLSFDIGYIRTTQLPATPGPNRGEYLILVKEYLIRHFEELTRLIRNMKWWTYADYQADPAPRCPLCGGNNLTLD